MKYMLLIYGNDEIWSSFSEDDMATLVRETDAQLVELRASASRPDRGICRLRQVTLNHRDETVMQQETTVFLKRRPVAAGIARS